jgi:hypothetical protein
LKIQNWIAWFQDRGKWKEVVEKDKTFNYRKFSAWKKKKKKKKKKQKKKKKKKKKKKTVTMLPQLPTQTADFKTQPRRSACHT